MNPKLACARVNCFGRVVLNAFILVDNYTKTRDRIYFTVKREVLLTVRLCKGTKVLQVWQYLVGTLTRPQ